MGKAPCGLRPWLPAMLLCAAMSTIPPDQPADSLLRRVYRRLAPEIEATLVDNAVFLLIFAGLLLAEITFRLFRYFGIDPDFLETMERWHHYAVLCIFAMFLLSLIRRAFLNLIFPPKDKPSAKKRPRN
jgi:hypothetical protein